jgi:hypothetical protein
MEQTYMDFTHPARWGFIRNVNQRKKIYDRCDKECRIKTTNVLKKEKS